VTGSFGWTLERYTGDEMTALTASRHLVPIFLYRDLSQNVKRAAEDSERKLAMSSKISAGRALKRFGGPGRQFWAFVVVWSAVREAIGELLRYTVRFHTQKEVWENQLIWMGI